MKSKLYVKGAIFSMACAVLLGCSTEEPYVYPDARTYSDLVNPSQKDPGMEEEFVELRNKNGTVRISLIGAYIVSYVPAGGKEVLFSVRDPKFLSGDFQHCGIPVVWPWFSYNGDPGCGFHGFARTMKWTVVSKEDTDYVSRLVLELASSDETLRQWPFDFRLRYTVTLSDQLVVSLVTENPNPVPFDITEALHAYFWVSDIDKAVLRGIDGCRTDVYWLRSLEPVFRGDLRIHGGEGRSFTAGRGQYVLFDEDAGRAICVAASGHRKVILWSISGTRKKPTTFSDDDWKHFLCIEPATWGREEAVRVMPGKQHELRMSIKAVPLDARARTRAF